MPNEVAQRTKTMTPYTQHSDQANPQTESSLEAAQGWVTAGGHRALLLESKNAPQLERGDVCMTPNILDTAELYTLDFMSCNFYLNKKGGNHRGHSRTAAATAGDTVSRRPRASSSCHLLAV